ncbi:MAG TPA: hypothetical protein DD670_03740 [Planctomycetaceae bacterium]|nr:hypothetical protein [Planctomycetaceae bacterium]
MMVATMERKGVSLQARDVSRQKLVFADDVPTGATVGELVEGLLTSKEMNLPRRDAEGRPLNYHARLEREGRHLHASELVGDVLQDKDEIVLQPNIQAGRI